MSSELDFSKDENIRFLYDKAVEARNFHYDNFTKWQTFFYVAVGSVLIAYCDVMTSGSSCREGDASFVQDFLKNSLPILGYLFSLIWLCSSRGHTYWWNAYMALLRRFEGENLLGRDYENGKPKNRDKNGAYAVYNGPKLDPCEGIINPFKGSNFSTSKLSNALAFVSTVSWGLVFEVSAWGSDNMGACKWIVFVLSPILFTWLFAGLVMRFFFPSNIEDFVKDDGIDAPRVCCRGCLAVFCFVVVAVVMFLFGLVANKSGCSCSLILAAVAELWFVLSIVLFAALGKLCRCS